MFNRTVIDLSEQLADLISVYVQKWLNIIIILTLFMFITKINLLLNLLLIIIIENLIIVHAINKRVLDKLKQYF